MGDPTKLVRIWVRIKADGVHIPAFMADSSAAYWVPRFRGGRQKAAERQPRYAFFFTSLTLEKVIPSARSRV